MKKAKEKSPSKLGWLKKLIIIILCVLLALVLAFVAFVVMQMVRPAKTNQNNPAETTTAVEYLNVPKTDIKQAAEGSVTKTAIKSDTDFGALNKLLTQHTEYPFAKYYDLDTVLKIEKNTPVHRTKDTSVLDANGNVDADKLYHTVLNNIEAAKNAKGKIKENIYYSEAEPQEVKEICNLIADTINSSKGDRDINETAAVLARLKIFRHVTTTNLAAVTQSGVFYFNPNMISVNSTLRNITGQSDKKFDDKVLTFIHEIEHLKQYGSADDDEENGMEAGPFRRYDDVTVNSLWDQWVLEAAAEIKMTEYLGVEPMVYAKKIGYMKSCNMAEIFNTDLPLNALVNTTFDNNLEEMFTRLHLQDKNEQRELLNLLYSIQLTQYDCDDFWENYQAQTGKTLTDEEHDAVRMDIRTPIIYHLTARYYQNLMDAVKKGIIRDEESLFYMLRLWELDCCAHLAYTQKNALPHADAYLVWHGKLNDAVFDALAKNSGRSRQDVKKSYLNYHPLVKENGKECRNYRFYHLSDERKAYIDACYNGYSVTHYTDIDTMLDYLNNKK